jgi:hypothetical protein
MIPIQFISALQDDSNYFRVPPLLVCAGFGQGGVEKGGNPVHKGLPHRPRASASPLQMRYNLSRQQRGSGVGLCGFVQRGGLRLRRLVAVHRVDKLLRRHSGTGGGFAHLIDGALHGVGVGV